MKTLSTWDIIWLIIGGLIYVSAVIYFTSHWFSEKRKKRREGESIPNWMQRAKEQGLLGQGQRGSEFGKGFVICLCKFIEHWPELGRTLKLYRKMHKKHSDLFFDNNAFEIWANASSDHLYEIEVPRRWKGKKVYDVAERLKDLGLTMGHGFTNKRWNRDEVVALKQMTYNVAKEIGFFVSWLLKLSEKYSIHSFNEYSRKFVIIKFRRRPLYAVNVGIIKRHIYWNMLKLIHRVAWVYDFALGLKPEIGQY